MVETMWAIDEDQLIRLVTAWHELQALHNGGVSNWDWYEDSLENYYDDAFTLIDFAIPLVKETTS